MSACDGYGTDAHSTDHATVEVRAPIAGRYCADCWRRWLTARTRPTWTDRKDRP